MIDKLLEEGINNNILVYDSEANGQFTRRLVRLMKNVLWNEYEDILDRIYVKRNDSFQEEGYEQVCFWEDYIKKLFTIQCVRLIPTSFEMEKFYEDLDCSYAFSDGLPTTKIVVGVGQNSNVILGTY